MDRDRDDGHRDDPRDEVVAGTGSRLGRDESVDEDVPGDDGRRDPECEPLPQAHGFSGLHRLHPAVGPAGACHPVHPVGAGCPIANGGSCSPVSSRKGGYSGVISAAKAPTRITQRLRPTTSSKMLRG